MNTTEKGCLAFDGILDMLSCVRAHHRSHVTHLILQSASLNPLLFQHPKVSTLSKTGMGIIKTVKTHLKQKDKKHAAASASSSDTHFHRSTVDVMELAVTKRANCQRIVVLGAPKVGKTNLLRRFLGKDFEEHYEPTSEDFHRKLFHIGGETYQVDLLDAAGERDFPAKRRLSILTGDIFLLVFSLDNRESFQEVCDLLNEIKTAKTKFLKLKTPPRVPVLVCGNKLDLCAQRTVSRLDVTQTLSDDVTFVETSAKDDSGLESMFRALASLGGLPDETSPTRHNTIPILTYRDLCVSHRGRRGSRGLSAPFAAVDPLAQRPSFTTDLRLVLGSSTKNNKPERCQIQ